MNCIIKTFPDYDTHRYGTPWAALSDSVGRPNFKGKTGRFTGGRGKGGVLFVVDPPERSVWVYGQRDYQNPNADKNYVQFRNGQFYPVGPDDLLAALDDFGEAPKSEPVKEAPIIKGVKKNSSRVTRHVSFTPEEDEAIRQRAEKAGMEVVPFIRYEALHGKVKSIPLDVVARYLEEIGEIARAVKEMVYRPHPDRWLYEADLEGTDDKVDEVLAIVKATLEEIRGMTK